MVYTGDDVQQAARRRSSVAIEPMTCPPNALRTGTSLVELDPGETWRHVVALKNRRAGLPTSYGSLFVPAADRFRNTATGSSSPMACVAVVVLPDGRRSRRTRSASGAIDLLVVLDLQLVALYAVASPIADRVTATSPRQAARQATVNSHEEQPSGLLAQVSNALDRFHEGQLDAADVDRFRFRYSRAAKELWKFCNVDDVECAGRVAEQPPIDWGRRGAPKHH